MGEGYECYTPPLYPGKDHPSPVLQEAGWASRQILKGNFVPPIAKCCIHYAIRAVRIKM